MSIPFLTGFLVFVALMLVLDLGILNRRQHTVSVKEALAWSGIWVMLAMLFNVGIYFFWPMMAPGSTQTPGNAAMTFLTGYMLEESLSMDNVFVFALIFAYFRVDHKYQHRVLYWGVIGAIVMRGIIICAGAALVSRFDWVLYIFGVILIYSSIRMAGSKSEAPQPDKNPVVKLARKFLPVYPDFFGKHFLKRDEVSGKQMITTLMIVLIVVETSDLVFASDSLPAIFAVTQDPTLIFTSNVFAILGLRSLYFVLADMIERFRFLNIGLSVVLSFIGVKILIKHFVDIPIMISLGFIALALGAAVAASLLRPIPSKEEKNL